MHTKIITKFIIVSILLLSLQMGAMADIIWSDNFESYPHGTYPSPDWTHTGSGDIYADSTNSSEGDQSLRIHGSSGDAGNPFPADCWKWIRQLRVSSSSLLCTLVLITYKDVTLGQEARV